MSVLYANPAELEARWGLNRERAEELSILLLAQRNGQIANCVIGHPMDQGRYAAAFERLFDKGLVCWGTNKGWFGGREPRNPETGRLLGGYLFLTRLGARQVLPYLADLSAEDHTIASLPPAQRRWVLEDKVLFRLQNGPFEPGAGPNAGLYGPTPGTPLGSQPLEVIPVADAPLECMRPDPVAGLGTPARGYKAWCAVESTYAGSVVRVAVYGLSGGIVDKLDALVALDREQRVAENLHVHGRVKLGEYDPQAVVQALAAQPCPTFSKSDLRLKGRIGRPLKTEAEAWALAHVPGTGIDALLAAARQERDASLAGPGRAPGPGR